MKTFTMAVAVAALALIAAPAQAQMGGKRGKTEDSAAESKNDATKKKVDERAYKAALERIPDPKEKYDPWGVARPSDSAKDTTKKPK